MLKLNKLVIALLWEYIARPLQEVISLYNSQSSAWAKCIVVLASPLLFVWKSAFQAPEGELQKLLGELQLLGEAANW